MVERCLFASDQKDVGSQSIEFVVGKFGPVAEGLNESSQIVGISFVVQTVGEVLNDRVDFGYRFCA